MAGPAGGKLNRRVSLERKTSGDDGHGGKEAVWRSIARPWVRAAPIGGKESLQAGTLQASQGWRVVMRPRDVTTADRLVPVNWRGMPAGTVLNIRSVADPEGCGEELVLFCDTMANP